MNYPHPLADRPTGGLFPASLRLVTTTLASLAAAAAIHAANVSWSTPQTISGDTNVNTTGTLVRAANLTRSGQTSDVNVTLNGVTFVRQPYTSATTTLTNGDTFVTSDSTAIGAFAGFGGASAPFNALSTSYQTLLTSGYYNDGTQTTAATTARTTLTLNNLTVGTTYLLQLWVHDYRIVNLGQNNPGLVTVIAGGTNTATLQHNTNDALGGVGQYVLGSFVANATSQTITFTGGNLGSDPSPPDCTALVNAYQLRSIATMTPPAITQQPQNQTIVVGGSATFSVTATGPGTLTYQWRKDGTAISGATGATFTVTNAQASQAGGYTVVVTNAAGSTTSSTATLTVNPLSAVLAFPEAEGYGKYTVGGRGGAIYEVTNLNDSGVGSLRAAVEASGPRIVVFRVSGTIVLTKNLTISNPYITIAGQTAPGDGICLRKYTLNINADEVIIRYLRIRYGDEIQTDADAVSMRYRKNIILDHVSASWGDDETLSLYHGENVTVQWCLIAETLNRGGSHGFAGIWGSPYSTFHHNLVAHCVSRNMRFASGGGNTDYRNNVIYNWGYNSAYGGEQQQVGNPTYYFSNINLVNNYYKAGPATQTAVRSRIVNPTYRDVKTDYGKFYVAGNHVVGNATVTADNWNGGVDPQGGTGDLALVRLTTPWPAMAIQMQTAQAAYTSVLAHVGCSKPRRDSVDTRIISEVTNGTATYGANGIIESQTQVGGWPVLASTAAPTDSDHDGMPDSWETARGLNPNNAADRNGDLDSDGYTNVEEYLNELGAF